MGEFQDPATLAQNAPDNLSEDGWFIEEATPDEYFDAEPPVNRYTAKVAAATAFILVCLIALFKGKRKSLFQHVREVVVEDRKGK